MTESNPKLKSERKYNEIIYLTPDAPTLNQSTCNNLSSLENIIILCGHYKGIDQRIEIPINAVKDDTVRVIK